MLIKALNEYYDILARNDKVCKDGFSRQNITHMIMLRKDGTVSDIINVEHGKNLTENSRLLSISRKQIMNWVTWYNKEQAASKRNKGTRRIMDGESAAAGFFCSLQKGGQAGLEV